jgi:hypothetical protein
MRTVVSGLRNGHDEKFFSSVREADGSKFSPRQLLPLVGMHFGEHWQGQTTGLGVDHQGAFGSFCLAGAVLMSGGIIVLSA